MKIVKVSYTFSAVIFLQNQLLFSNQSAFIIARSYRIPMKRSKFTVFCSPRSARMHDHQTLLATEPETEVSQSTALPSLFINQILRQWPSWHQIKQQTGIYRPPAMQFQNGSSIQYTRSREVPLPKILSRGRCRFYKYYVNKEDGVTFFYPESCVWPAEFYQQVDHLFSQQQLYPLLELAGEAVTMVPTSVALPEIDKIKQRIKGNAIKLEKVGNWVYAY